MAYIDSLLSIGTATSHIFINPDMFEIMTALESYNLGKASLSFKKHYDIVAYSNGENFLLLLKLAIKFQHTNMILSMLEMIEPRRQRWKKQYEEKEDHEYTILNTSSDFISLAIYQGGNRFIIDKLLQYGVSANSFEDGYAFFTLEYVQDMELAKILLSNDHINRVTFGSSIVLELTAWNNEPEFMKLYMSYPRAVASLSNGNALFNAIQNANDEIVDILLKSTHHLDNYIERMLELTDEMTHWINSGNIDRLNSFKRCIVRLLSDRRIRAQLIDNDECPMQFRQMLQSQ